MDPQFVQGTSSEKAKLGLSVQIHNQNSRWAWKSVLQALLVIVVHTQNLRATNLEASTIYFSP